MPLDQFGGRYVACQSRESKKAAEYVAPIAEVIWSGNAEGACQRQSVGYRQMSAPHDRFHERIWQHDTAPESDARISTALPNDRLGLGFDLSGRKAQLPCIFEWQNLHIGHYAFRLKLATHHALGAAFARERGEEILLNHGETRRYDSELRIHANQTAVFSSRQRIWSKLVQVDDQYPTVPGNDPLLIGPKT